MERYIAFLRGVNISGKNRVPPGKLSSERDDDAVKPPGMAMASVMPKVASRLS